MPGFTQRIEAAEKKNRQIQGKKINFQKTLLGEVPWPQLTVHTGFCGPFLQGQVVSRAWKTPHCLIERSFTNLLQTARP